MATTTEILRPLVHNDRFPRSNTYDPLWAVQNQMGPNVLWLTEWLCEALELHPGMRVLDMGCGKAISSVFLAKEYGVQVWANDLWISADDNWNRIRDAGVEHSVFPIHAEAHALPYAAGFFDAIVSMDSYHYYGTDDLFMSVFHKFVKPGGPIGIVVPALMRDFPDGVPPEYLTRKQKSGGVFWVDECWTIHTLDWWREHWGRNSSIEIEVADVLEDGSKHWLQHERATGLLGSSPFPSDEEVLQEDAGKYLGFARLVARRRST